MNRNSNGVIIRMTGPSGNSIRFLCVERFTIGRVGADFIVQDKGVSRSHLTVSVKANTIFLEDMGSANGTFVGEKRLTPHTPVSYEIGTPIRLGVCKDLVAFELAERVSTATEIQNSPSLVLQSAPPSADVAAQADQFLKEAREFAQSTKENAGREAEATIDAARTKAHDIVAKARAEAEALLSGARNTASESVRSREQAAEEMLAHARKEVIHIKNVADEEAERVTNEARIAASQIKLAAQKESEELLRLARERATETERKTEAETAELVREVREKNRLAIERNEEEMERTLREARETAARIRAEADQVLEKARAHVEDKGQNLLRQAREQAEKLRAETEAEIKRLRQEAQEEADRVRGEARAEGSRTVESGLRDAHREIENVKEAARREIERLQESREKLQGEIAEFEKRRTHLTGDTESRRKEHEEALRRSAELSAALEAVRAEQEKAKADLALSRTLKEEAEKVRDSALKACREAEAQADQVRREATAQKEELAKEINELRAKGMHDFEDRKKSVEAELASMKLKWIEETKARQIEDEARQRALRAHQAVEIARHLEMLLVPIIQQKMDQDASTEVLSELKKELEPMVKRVVLEEQSPEGGSEIEQVIAADPIIEKLKKRERLRRNLAFAVPMMALLVAIFAPDLFGWARDPVAFFSGRTLAEIAAEEQSRKLASLPKFNPEQTDELRASYTDSVIHTRLYTERKLDPRIEKKWILELNKYLVNDLSLPEQAIVGFIAAESNLVRELKELREKINPEFQDAGIGKMRDLESQMIGDLKGKVGGDVMFEKIRGFEKKFFDNLRAPAQATEPSSDL